MYPRATTASFTIAWADIAKPAPYDADSSFRVDVPPLSQLVRRVAGDGRDGRRDAGLSPLSSESMDRGVLTSSRVEIDLERSGRTVPLSEETLRDPDYSPLAHRMASRLR